MGKLLLTLYKPEIIAEGLDRLRTERAREVRFGKRLDTKVPLLIHPRKHSSPILELFAVSSSRILAKLQEFMRVNTCQYVGRVF